MNKDDLNIKLANKLNITITQARAIVNTMLEIIATTLSKREPVFLRGFGKFFVRHQVFGAYVRFKAAIPLKRRIRGG